MVNQLFPFRDMLAQLNISITDLAKFLQVSDSLARKYINNIREMRGKQVFSLSQLSTLIYKSKDNPNFLPQRLAAEKKQLKQKLKARNVDVLSEIKKTEQRLAEMKLAHSQALDALRRFTIMDLSTVKLEKSQEVWIFEMKLYWEAMIPRVDTQKQYDLTLKIELLKHEYSANTQTLKSK
jgi:hypothetical protein